MTFFIDPKIKEVGASEMKDWIIFGLIILVLGVGGYNVSSKLQDSNNKLESRVASLEGSKGDAATSLMLTARVEALESKAAAKPKAVIKKKVRRWR